MKPITIERLSTPLAKNQTGHHIKHDWNQLPYVFPPEYIEFLELFNGYCGFLGTSYVDWLQFEELMKSNESYQMQAWFPGVTLIGGDGGGMGYAINQDGQFIAFDLVGDYMKVVADNFDDFVDYIYTYDWGDDK